MSRTEQCGDSAAPSGAQAQQQGGGVGGGGGGAGGGGVLQVLRNWETPAAYRSRLRLAVVLVVLGLGARYINGGRLPLEKLFNHLHYSWGDGGANGGGTYAVVVGPNLGLLLLSIVLRFMMARPQVGAHDEEPPPPPPAAAAGGAQDAHAHDE